MTERTARTLSQAEGDADAALAHLGKALNETLDKGQIDHGAEGRAAREEALEHGKDAADQEQQAATARADAKTSATAGNTDESNRKNAEADVHDMTAAGHQEVSETLHELHAHHMEKSCGLAGADHDALAKECMDVGKEHAARAYEHTTKVSRHGDLAKGGAFHHGEMAKRYGGFSDRAAKLAKVMGDCQGKCAMAKAAAAKAADLAKGDQLNGEKGISPDATAGSAATTGAAAANVVPVTGLKQTADGWVDVHGVGFFGKASYSDAQRQAMASSGHAMADGSFPILDKATLQEAIAAFKHAPDHAKVAEFIQKRGTELKEQDLLKSEGFDGAIGDIVRVKGPTKTPESGAAAAPGADEAGRQAAGVQPNLAADTKGLGDGKGDKAIDSVVQDKGATKTPASGADAAPGATEEERQAAGVQKRAQSIAKGMGIVAGLAQLVAQAEALYQAAELEQASEGDDDSKVCDAIDSVVSAATSALKTAVDEETKEVAEGTDVEAYAAAAKAAHWQGLQRLAKYLRDLATPKAVADVKKRAGLKLLADALDKAYTLAKAADASKAPAEDLEKRVKEARAEAESRAVTLLDRFTKTTAATAIEVGRIRKEGTEMAQALAKANEEIKRLGGQPLPAKGHSGAKVIAKVGEPSDQSGVNKSAMVETIDTAIASGTNTAQAIIDAGLAARERLLHGGRKQ